MKDVVDLMRGKAPKHEDAAMLDAYTVHVSDEYEDEGDDEGLTVLDELEAWDSLFEA